MDFPTHHFHWQTGQRAGKLFCFKDRVTDLAMLAGAWVFSRVFQLYWCCLLRRDWLLTASPFPCPSFFNIRKYCGKGVTVNYPVGLFSNVYRNPNLSITKITQYSYGVSDARTNRLFTYAYIVSWNFRYWHFCR